MSAEDVKVTEEDIRQLVGCFNEITSVFSSPVDVIGQLPSRNFPLSNKHFNTYQNTGEAEVLTALYR